MIFDRDTRERLRRSLWKCSMVRKMRFAHFPHHTTLPWRGKAARRLPPGGWETPRISHLERVRLAA